MHSLLKTTLPAVFAMCALVLTSSAVRADDTPTVTITFKNGTFEPMEMTLPRDTKAKLVLVNEDSKAVEFESHDMKAEKIINAGKTRSVFVGPLKAGEYSFFDEFNEAAGKGKVVVE